MSLPSTKSIGLPRAAERPIEFGSTKARYELGIKSYKFRLIAEHWGRVGGMGALNDRGIFLFESFRLDRQARALCRRDAAGEFAPIAVGSRAFEVLDVLVGRSGDLVSRDEFMTVVWPSTAVEDINLMKG